MSNVTINHSPQSTAIAAILAQTWGETSILTHVENVATQQECDAARKTNNPSLLDGKTIGVTTEINNETIGCVVLKVHPWREIELGSLAVLPEYRGQGVSHEMISSLNAMCEFFTTHGYILTAFATIGSGAMHKVVNNMKKLSGTTPLVLQFTPGVVPVETNAVSTHISLDLLFTEEEKSFTSTLQLMCCTEVSFDTTWLKPETLKLPSEVTTRHAVFSAYSDNQTLSLPIRLELVTIFSPDLEKLKTTMEEVASRVPQKTIQYRIPLSQEFRECVSHLLANTAIEFTGLTINDGYVFLVFLANSAPHFEHIKSFLAAFPEPEIAHLVDRNNAIIAAL